MRDVKYRGWEKKHSYEFDVEQIDFRSHTVLTPSGKRLGFDEVELREYTGLKDKNGVEIYEGDIIDTHVKSGRYMKVYYNEDCASFMTAGLGDIAWVKTGGLGKDMCSYIEVIGNIYENPELLEQAA